MRTTAIIVDRFRKGLLVALIATVYIPVFARQTPVQLNRQARPIQVSFMGLYQSYNEDGPSVDQLSFPVSFVAPLGPNANMTFRASQTSVSGDEVESLSGLGDAQVSVGYAHAMRAGSLILNLGLNLPSGKRELTDEEFQTLVHISQSALDYRVPSLGQGVGLSPSITYAVPVSGNLVFGVGVSYRLRGGFKPIQDMTEDYVPGDELLLTTGLDVRVGPATSASIDVTYALYAADKLGDDDIFEAGSKTTVVGLLRHVRGFQEWRLTGLIRMREKSSLLSDVSAAAVPVQTIPNEIMLQASYSARINNRLGTTFLVEGRIFDKTPSVPARDIYDIGVSPRYRLSQETTLVGRFIYTAGTIEGFEGGIGLNVSM